MLLVAAEDGIGVHTGMSLRRTYAGSGRTVTLGIRRGYRHPVPVPCPSTTAHPLPRGVVGVYLTLAGEETQERQRHVVTVNQITGNGGYGAIRTHYTGMRQR